MTVDEILAQREYLDRCGREWNLTDYWVDRATFDYVQMWLSPDRVATQDEMRLLIERDMHRDACPRLSECKYHPRPHILTCEEVRGWFMVFEPNAYFERRYFESLPDAMDAAYRLAVAG